MVDLGRIDAPAFERQRPRGVDPERRDLVVDVERLEIFGDIPPVLGERSYESAKDIVQGNVVITRHNDLRFRQTIQKSACGLELGGASALREISRNSDEVGRELGDHRSERRQQRIIGAAEMKIRQVNDRAHGSGSDIHPEAGGSGLGTMTFNAPGITRNRSGVSMTQISPSVAMCARWRRVLTSICFALTVSKSVA